MKVMRVFTVTVAVLGLALTLAHAEEGKPKGEGKHGPRGAGPGPMMEHLLPPRAVEDLNLTADQKAKLDELEGSFKKDAEKWREAHPITDADKEAMKKARESGDKAAMGKFIEQRKELAEIRKGYVDKFRATLTDEQKAKLDKSIEEAKSRMGKGAHGDKGEKKGPKPPPAE